MVSSLQAGQMLNIASRTLCGPSGGREGAAPAVGLNNTVIHSCLRREVVCVVLGTRRQTRQLSWVSLTTVQRGRSPEGGQRENLGPAEAKAGRGGGTATAACLQAGREAPRPPRLYRLRPGDAFCPGLGPPQSTLAREQERALPESYSLPTNPEQPPSSCSRSTMVPVLRQGMLAGEASRAAGLQASSLPHGSSQSLCPQPGPARDSKAALCVHSLQQCANPPFDGKYSGSCLGKRECFPKSWPP